MGRSHVDSIGWRENEEGRGRIYKFKEVIKKLNKVRLWCLEVQVLGKP